MIPLSPRPWVWYVSNPHHKANKIVAVHCVRFTSSTTHSARLLAGQAMERAALRSARACGNGSPCLCWRAWTPRCFSLRTRVSQGGQPILGPVFNVQLKLQLKSTSIKSKLLSDTNTVWVLTCWVYYSYGWHLCLVHAFFNYDAHKLFPFICYSLFDKQIFQLNKT